MAALTGTRLDWSTTTLTRDGERECGDACVVRESDAGMMFAVLDAIGHGPEAAASARLLTGLLQEAPASTGVARLLGDCHAALRGRRGAAIGVAVIAPELDCLQWIGVGNISAVLLRGRASGGRAEPLLSRSGLLGDQIPELRPVVRVLRHGDGLVVASDGLRSDFADELADAPAIEPDAMVEWLLARFARRADDATVLAIRVPESA